MSNSGEQIRFEDGELKVPNKPIIPFIQGDGTGPDIWKASQHVFDSAVQRAYGGKRSIAWTKVLAGEESFNKTKSWLPEETLESFKKYLIGIKGPLTTPVGGGIRSLNVALRQKLDLFACVRPVRWFQGVPSPLIRPQDTDMIIFRENSEDIYAGIEFQSRTKDCEEFKKYLKATFPERYNAIRFPDTAGFGIKPVSQEGTNRIVKAAINYAIQNARDSVTLVHKGNIMKYTEGSFRDWGYELAKKEFGAVEIDGGPWCELEANGKKITIKDSIADAFLQQILLRPKEYDVIATMNLNGDYVSDALAACVGGIGIAPGANINYDTGNAIFEATHGTAPKYANKDVVNPCSVILSGAMMLRYIKWVEAADLVIKGIEGAIESKRVTYDFARQMKSAEKISCSAFAENIVAHM